MLKRIAREKARLAKAGEIGKEKPPPAVDEDDDFDIPPTWRWTRLGIVTSYIQRGKSPKYAASDGSLVVSQKCAQWRQPRKQVTLESLADYEDIRFLRDGDLLWNSTGTGTIGRVIRLVDPPEKIVCDSHGTVVHGRSGLRRARGRSSGTGVESKNAFVRVIWAMVLAISRATAAILSLWKIVAQ